MFARLGVNIDHIATLRQLRGTPYPHLILMAKWVSDAGADQITVHLREDRRHIQDQDVVQLKKSLSVPLNLEMCTTSSQILNLALKVKPAWVCLVPEKRQEVTTEGGLDLSKNTKSLSKTIKALQSKEILVSAFVEPNIKSVKLAKNLGVNAVELHTGSYSLKTQKKANWKSAVKTIQQVALEARSLGLHVHAGHGLDYKNVRVLVELEIFEEFNIGHSIVCRSVEVGIKQAVREMKAAVQAP
jgi:pyridoxine 5-phosphate synthase